MHPFRAEKISEHVYWVGAIDREIRDFHGYSTTRGTTYNAFLVLGEEPVLIDTVKAPFFEEMLSRIASVIEPEKISYIISNHAEMDHSGSLPQAIERMRPKKVFASKMGVKALQAHFHFEYELTPLENTQCLTLGNMQFTFVETRMLHWPDSMVTYFAQDGILFSQDGFGMHLAVDDLFAQHNDYAVMEHEAKKYFANILLPYSNFVSRLLKQLPTLNLDVRILAPDHGPLWSTPKDIAWILGLWEKWALQTPSKKVVVVYDSMWGSTGKMANAIADGVLAQGGIVKLLPLSVTHRSDVMTEMLDAGGLLVGSPTLNGQIFPTIADILCYMKGLKPKNLKGQAFGSHGWSADAVRIIQNDLENMGVELVGGAVSVQYVPTAEVLHQCQLLGGVIADSLMEKANG